MVKKIFNFYEAGEYKIFIICGIKISVKKKKKNGKTIEDIMNYYDKKINAITNEIKTSNFLLKEIYIEKYANKVLEPVLLETLMNSNYGSVYNAIHGQWARYIDDKQLITVCNLISKRYNIWTAINSNFWLIYISLLYKNDNKILAKELLLKYYEKFHSNRIHNVLIAAKLAKEIGITNENIEKSVLIYNKLNENIEKNIFENAIKGKTVAVVGNGPQEIGKGYGEEIDSHDIIIRFNNFNIKGFEKDYGSKTDIWVRGFQASKYEKGINRDYNIMYCYEGDLNCALLQDDIIEKLYNDISNNTAVFYFKNEIHRKIFELSNIHSLTSGGLVLFNVLEIKNKYNESFTKKDIYGFSFLNNDLSYDGYHYYIDNIPKKDLLSSLNNWHKINEEMIFLRKLFNIEN